MEKEAVTSRILGQFLGVASTFVQQLMMFMWEDLEKLKVSTFSFFFFFFRLNSGVELVFVNKRNWERFVG